MMLRESDNEQNRSEVNVTELRNTCATDVAPGCTSDALPEKKAKAAREILTAEQTTWFDLWWDAYWLHRARKPAMVAFSRHVQTAERFDAVMAATRAQTPEMLAREPSKRPHGASWLNAERWTDDTAEVQATGLSSTLDRIFR